MAGEMRREIRLVADLSSLQQDMQRVAQELKQLSNEVINVQMKVGGRDVTEVINDLRAATGAGGGPGTIFDAQGQPISSTQQKMNIPAEVSVERAAKAAEKFGKELENIKQQQQAIATTMAEASAAQREILQKELQKLGFQEKNIRQIQSILGGSGGGGAGATGGGSMIGQLMNIMKPAALMAGAGRIAAEGFQIPMHLMRARAATAGITTRDIQSAGRLESFEDILRLQSDVRGEAKAGRRAGIAGNIAGGMGWGAGIGAAAGSIIPGVGTLLGAGIGAAGGGLYRMMTGQAETAGVQGFEEAISAQAAMQGGRGELFNMARGRGRARLPFQLGMGIGDPQMQGMSMGGIMQNAGQFGIRESEMLQGLTGVMGAGGGATPQNMSLLSILGRGTGIGLGQLGQGMMGAGGAGGDSIQEVAKTLAIAVSEGFDNSEQFKRYLDATLSLAQAAGGGGGAAGFRAASDAMGAARDVFGIQAATPGIGQNFMNLFSGMQTKRTGFMGVANFTAAQKVLSGNAGFQRLQRDNPTAASRLMIQMSDMDPAMLQDTNVQNMLTGAGITNVKDMAGALITERSAQQALFHPFGGAELSEAIRQGDDLSTDQQLTMQMISGNQGMLGFQFGNLQQSMLRRSRRGADFVDINAVAAPTVEGRARATQGLREIQLGGMQEQAQLTMANAGMPVVDRAISGLEQQGGGIGIATQSISNLDEVTKSASFNINKMGKLTFDYNVELERTIGFQKAYNEALSAGIGDRTDDKSIATEAGSPNTELISPGGG